MTAPDTTKAPEGGLGSLRPSDCVPGEREAVAKAILAAELKGEKDLHPSNRRRALRARANKARKFPTNTCPASRHVHMMADYLSTDGYYQLFEDEPLHCAGSLYATVSALWEARTRIAALEAATASSVGTQKPSGFGVDHDPTIIQPIETSPSSLKTSSEHDGEALRHLRKLVEVYGDMQDGNGHTPTEIRRAKRFLAALQSGGEGG